MKINECLSAIKFSVLIALLVSFLGQQANGQNPEFNAELILPFQEQHLHGSTIVELSNGDLLASWFHGSGERWADDVQTMGARKKEGSTGRGKPCLMADVEGVPDINPVVSVDEKDRLWLFRSEGH